MISVVVPTYNEEASIATCLESLADQTVPRAQYELIVVDGNSTDRTREIAAANADLVMIQTSKKVGGARNDGVLKSRGAIVATTDADCIIPPDWIERIEHDFATRQPVQLYGLVDPKEPGVKHRISLALANSFSRIGHHTHTVYYTLGCNTAFSKEAFVKAGMYRTIDAGDDLEIARRMRTLGRVVLDPKLRVKFSMRRYDQFGTVRSLYEWLYIATHGGESSKYSYSRRKYK
ncbi:MAG: glycosyltransferase [Methanobacteriota archaeon]|nr:MAG: glycosyltransferase [Euryarchaeota archaeon]